VADDQHLWKKSPEKITFYHRAPDKSPWQGFESYVCHHDVTKRFMKTKRLLNATLEEIGSALSELRIKKGFDTVTNFAATFDLPPNQYWKIENGKSNITIKTLLRLLEIHRITLEEFFCTLRDSRS
jgi:hypothetical protein